MPVFNLEKIIKNNKEISNENVEPKVQQENTTENKDNEETEKEILKFDESGEIITKNPKEKDEEENTIIRTSKHSVFSHLYGRITDAIKPLTQIADEFDKVMMEKQKQELTKQINSYGIDAVLNQITKEAIEFKDENKTENTGISKTNEEIKDITDIINNIKEPDKKYQAQQVLIKLKTQPPGKIDLEQFNFEKDSAEKIQLTLQGQLKFGKDNTKYYKCLSDKQIIKLRSIQVLQQKFPNKISKDDILKVAKAGTPQEMENQTIEIAHKKGITEIPFIKVSSEMVNDSVQRIISLDQIIEDKTNEAKTQNEKTPKTQTKTNDEPIK